LYNYSANTQYIGKQLLYLTSCHSTNDLAKALISKGLSNNGMVIVAENQTAGRGQQGTQWSSEKGKNLLFSLIFRFNKLPHASQFLFNKTLSIHLLGFFRTYFSNMHGDFHIKWPNDVYLNGKKVAGILIENSLSGSNIHSSIVGIGINVNQQSFEFPGASSLSVILQREIDRYDLLNNLLLYLDENLSLEYESLHPAQIQTINKVYDSTLWGLHELRSYRTTAGKTFQAILKGVDEQGLLILETPHGIERFEIKSIQFVH
jgi:BirA family biotin operon repressor/biotin-[acetyl-CoA-carboxylase] ligase